MTKSINDAPWIFEKLHDRISGCSICTANPPQKTLVGPTKIKHTERNIEENAGNDWDSVGFPPLFMSIL